MRTAVVTGGTSGLGRAMALGLMRAGCRVLAVGHLAADAAETERLAGAGALSCLVADLREAGAADRVLNAAAARFGDVDILVNNAGLTFTYIDPGRFRDGPRRFHELSDAINANVMAVNFLAAEALTRRAVPGMIARGWGRVVNVTTKLDTMNRVGSSAYGASKAALEMASEIWAKELEGTGVTVNVVNPGAGANTPGMAEEMRAWSAAGTKPRLVEPEEMVAPLLFVVSDAANGVNGFRFDANAWDARLPPEQAARAIARPAGFAMHPARAWDER
ncbi:MAG: SDR family oxidoreductase [Rhodospirillales bacterium]|nr:SDR family oxidoreductase [Rhodospirillales bacterium]